MVFLALITSPRKEFMECKYKTTKRGRENDLMLLKPIKKEFKKVSDPDVSIKEKRKVLSKPQVGHGIFTLLAGTILPELISLFTKREILN